MESDNYIAATLFTIGLILTPSAAQAQSYMDRFQGGDDSEEEEASEVSAAEESDVTVAAVEYVAPVVTASISTQTDPVLEELRALRSDLEMAGITSAEVEQVARLETINEQLVLLQEAVDQGLDPEIAAVSRTALEAEAASLQGLEDPSEWSAGIGFNSHYAWRGLNYLQSTSQKDKHAYVSPWLSWAIGDSGWSVGYWGAYQATGDNISDMAAGASSHENDLWVDWSTDLSGGALTANVYGLAYLYPFADADVAGTDVPTWVEPGAGLTWNGPVSIGASAAWYQAVQSPLQGGEYLYLNTSISGERSVHDMIGVGLGASAGYKAGQGYIDNTLDVQLDWTMSVALDQLTLAPGTHVTWTNFEGATPGEGYFVWWGIETEFAL